jgi:hypothetical protein
MSYEDGWAALNLEMPRRVPRTEYSAAQHWELVARVTGIDVSFDSSKEVQQKASRAFASPDHWNFDLQWSTLISRRDLGENRTSMGHAVYADGGTDYNDDIRARFATPEEALAFDPMESLDKPDHGATVRRFEDHYRANCAATPEAVNMTGIYITCISGLIELFGWDMLLLAAGTDPDAFGRLTNRYAEWIGRYYDALADADVPVVMVHDDIVWTSGAFIHPDWYRRFVFPNYKRYFAPLIESGKKILFTSDGNYDEFVDDIADCGVHGFIMEPLTDMAAIAERYGESHVIVGNADTRILLSGDRAAIRAEVERCMAIGKDCPGFFMAVGNHIPSNTPVDAAIYYNEVYEALSSRTG